MSIQDKIEHILKDIHLLFSNSEPYRPDEAKIIVEKQAVFHLLEQLNLAFYQAMDQYEITKQKHELAERRCEKKGEEIIQKASRHADDIYAASIMYTDDAINRICHIMEDANEAVKKIYRNMDFEMEEQRERIRRNQLELTGQLRDFADTNKYVKLIEEENRKLEKERRQQLEGKKQKKIQNEGKTYSSEKPEIKINQEYFARAGNNPATGQSENGDGNEEDLSKVTGKAFAESLRRRAARKAEVQKTEPLEADMADDLEKKEDVTLGKAEEDDVEKSRTGDEKAAITESQNAEKTEEGSRDAEEKKTKEPDVKEIATGSPETEGKEDLLSETEKNMFSQIGETGGAEFSDIQVNLDAEYFKWKESGEDGMQQDGKTLDSRESQEGLTTQESKDEQKTQEKKTRRFPFGKRA